MSDPSAVVARYFEIVADLGSSRDALLDVLHPDAPTRSTRAAPCATATRS